MDCIVTVIYISQYFNRDYVRSCKWWALELGQAGFCSCSFVLLDCTNMRSVAQSAIIVTSSNAVFGYLGKSISPVTVTLISTISRNNGYCDTSSWMVASLVEFTCFITLIPKTALITSDILLCWLKVLMFIPMLHRHGIGYELQSQYSPSNSSAV